MSNVEITAPKQRVIGRPFAPGQSGNPAGRPKGSRNRLADSFIADLATAWGEYGEEALRRCAEEEPGTFVKVIAGLLPKSIDLNVAIDVASFADRFRAAAELLGHDIDPPRLHRPLRRGPPIIEHADVD
jgi:hypothetical protein